ncbi:MAG: transcription-repair coupling factor, partial [Bacteriovoracaceae bacterium]|nr:transcription-repair coupling factor [Bacteriovoracaceae bacterium]
HINPTLSKSEFIKESLNFLQKEFKHSGLITFCSYTDGSKQEIKHLIELLGWSEDLKNRTRFEQYRMDDGFWYEPEKTIVISDADLFAAKKNKTQKKKSIDVDLFAEQLATLKIGDYVIHSEYGVGEYLGLESLEIGGEKSDFLILKYSENDKVYVPVYKLNLIQKHADSHAGLKVDSLRTNKFTALKARAKISVKQLAFDLLKLQAERQMSQAYAFSEPDHLYKEFELAFPFDETPDQTKAIEAVLENMQKPVPMDHLVCGDVGFGKTEVAMRAAFKAVEDKKQVALLVPTTILALQHYNSFVKRFKDFPIKIEFVSRFKTAKESKEIFNRTEAGHVDILIGTHKLLSDGLRFKDLGLVIVDEEQRFGVGHKEKLKLLKSSVDFLTLTATPIPRTLQMAFLGLRELSLIKTAPPKRQSIKTYIIKEDEYTLQMAIKKELQRGGQVFIVHNKVNDMEQFVANIRDLVPEAKIVYAHGQMSEKELEDRVSAFYNGDYQILIATTIIESGIDIPNANTMIIDRADTFGLAQLHQLRGRIGRSDKKAYAYFVIPRFKDISGIAQKRLHALQTYADMGSGFNIANVDLEIRGAGDILGASQSGHIEAIGLELYMELLKEAIQEIRGERKIIKKDIEIQTPFPAFIPNHYIKDSMDRLKNYKRISNCETLGQLEALREEFEDIFGVFPEEIHNLFTLLEVRIHLQTIGLKSLSVAGNNLILKFDKSVFETHTELRDKVVQYFLSRPKVYQFTPDFKVIYSHKDLIRQSDLIRLSKEIAEQIIPSK